MANAGIVLGPQGPQGHTGPVGPAGFYGSPGIFPIGRFEVTEDGDGIRWVKDGWVYVGVNTTKRITDEELPTYLERAHQDARQTWANRAAVPSQF